MSLVSSILVPLDGSRLAARSLGCAAWLAARLGARLHVLGATPRALPARAALTRLRVPEEHRPLITLHQAKAYPEEAILTAVARHDVSLVVMTTKGQTAETEGADPDPTRIIGHVAHAVIERSPVPVLLLPPAYREALPWERILVPVSGEVDADAALTLAVRLAHQLDLAVHVAHVIDEEAGDEGLAARARYADALHHEYPEQLTELVERALPQCSSAERGRIAEVALLRGDVAAELIKMIERRHIGALAVGWHGRFMGGHARVLKHLLQTVPHPVLLVKPTPGTPFRLKVGEEIE
jgi:nucleotide-binding universal stress UspA family protein